MGAKMAFAKNPMHDINGRPGVGVASSVTGSQPDCDVVAYSLLQPAFCDPE